jgi:hypothetical protein
MSVEVAQLVLAAVFYASLQGVVLTQAQVEFVYTNI